MFTLGAVAYDPKVVTIWEGFKDWFAAAGFAFDYVLYSNYEAQVDALVRGGEIDAAWNSPLAWVRSARLTSGAVEAVAMRDTDCGLTSVVVVRADSDIATVTDLTRRRVGVGAVDSPQATLIPLWHLSEVGAVDVAVVHHNVGVGKHGDHIGGERDAARALLAGDVDAACMIDENHLLFGAEGTLPAGSTRILTQTPAYDHCNFTVLSDAAAGAGTKQFVELLLGMSYDDPAVRPLLELEGLKAWLPGRTNGYGPLESAVDRFGFYRRDGSLP